MKRNISLILVVGAALAIGLVCAQNVAADISGSAHDFSGSGYGSTEICIFCHTPHDADTTVTNAPLWNHALSATTGYTMYDSSHSSTIENTVDSSPNPMSRLCLSCHDGTVAVDSFGGATGTTFLSTDAATDGYIGKDLTVHHPISIVYDNSASGDPGLNATTTAVGSTSLTVADILYSTKVECASCHDVHNQGEVGAASLLVADNDGSALCLSCHDK
jgi:predicted CXXCH cytochrome family protein